MDKSAAEAIHGKGCCCTFVAEALVKKIEIEEEAGYGQIKSCLFGAIENV